MEEGGREGGGRVGGRREGRREERRKGKEREKGGKRGARGKGGGRWEGGEALPFLSIPHISDMNIKSVANQCSSLLPMTSSLNGLLSLAT